MTTTSFSCTIAPGGTRFVASGHASLLDAALAQGVAVPFSCQRGACGSCRAQVLQGQWARNTPAKPDSYPVAPDEALLCQCHATSDMELRFPHWTAPARPPQRQAARVVSQRPLAADVQQLLLELPAAQALDVQPGQHLQLLLDDGTPRNFSIAHSFTSGDTQRLELHIRRVPGGRFSDRHLARLRPGDTLDIQGPYGSCTWPPADLQQVEHLVLLATGTGFAGLRAILLAALEQGQLQTVTLYWGGRHADDCYPATLLDKLQQEYPALRWLPVLSSADTGQRHVQHAALAQGHDWPRSLVYACGNPAMVREARALLCQAGLPADRYRSESFVPAVQAAAPPAHAWERVGAHFTLDGILSARRRSVQAVYEIAALMYPGISTAEAVALADAHLQAMGSPCNWHPTYVRFGPDTQSPPVQPTDRQRRLQPNDIFVVDIGPVWDGYEGDFGDTFVLGDSATHQRCARAAREVFEQSRTAWRGGLTGEALYAHVDTLARARGCTVVRELGGHRVADFPHALYGKQQLVDADFIPGDGIWVLEIQLRDLAEPVGAFYEDVLLHADLPALA